MALMKEVIKVNYSVPNLSILKVVLLSSILAYIGWALHRAWFGSLAHLPGPTLSRYSSLWRIKNAASTHAPINFRNVHKQHGSVVRIGPTHVSVSDPAQIPVIYGISSKFKKSRFYDTLTPLHDGKNFYSIFSQQDQEAHRKLRSGIAQKYSLSSLLSLEPLVDRVTETFISALRSRESSILDLGEWAQFYAFDVIGAITFSKTFGFIDAGSDDRGVIKGLEGGLKYAAVVGQVPELHPFLMGSPFLQAFMASVPAIARGNPVPIVFKMIIDSLATTDTKSHNPNCEDFATYLKKQNQKDPEKITESTMINHMFVNLLAGSDTTAISLRTIFYLLMKNPRTYAKLQAEIDAADEAGVLSPIIKYAEAQAHVPYLALVIKEALRCHPAVALTLERIVPEGGLRIDDYYIPEGTIVGINAWVIHYDKDVFGEDVHTFRPERWEESDGEKDSERLKKMERSFFAFGHGARSCIGKNISLMEMGKFVPQFLREFSIEWAGESNEWKVNSSWFAKQSNVSVRYKRRDQSRGESINKEREKEISAVREHSPL